MPFQLIATLPGGAEKSMLNRSEETVDSIVAEFLRDGTLTTRWGKKEQTRQALELRIYKTADKYSKRNGTLSDFVSGKRNLYPRFEKRLTEKARRPKSRVFVVMPIQGDRFGTQSEQTVYQSYSERFARIQALLETFDCVAIRIDKEEPLGGLVERIKEEIGRARFVIADLTDERPSCYYEFGYAEASGKPVIPIASRESIMHPGTDTKIHFDIHQNVRLFSNLDEMVERLRDAIEQNRPALVDPIPDPPALSTYNVFLSNTYSGFTLSPPEVIYSPTGFPPATEA